MRLHDRTWKISAWLIVSFGTIYASSCVHEVKMLPSDDRIIQGIMFCSEELDQTNWMCMSKASFVEQETLLIQCREVLKRE